LPPSSRAHRPLPGVFYYFDQFLVEYESCSGESHEGVPGRFPFPDAEEELRPSLAKGWAEMIRKVYEVDPLTCPRCGGMMKIIAFLTEYAVVEKIINHLNLTFMAERPVFSSVLTDFCLAMSNTQLNLTSDDPPIYHHLRRGGAKSVP